MPSHLPISGPRQERLDILLQRRAAANAAVSDFIDTIEQRDGKPTRSERVKLDNLETQAGQAREAVADHYRALGITEPEAASAWAHNAASARANGLAGRTEGDGGVGLGREQRVADHVAEQRGGHFAGDLEALDPSEFNLARCVKGMVTGERADLTETERRAMSEGVSADGGFLLPAPLAAQVIDLARAKSQVLNAGARTIVMDSATLSIPRLASGVSGEWKLENDPVGEESQTYERVVFTARTAITLIRLSRELWEDATQAAHSIFESDLVAALSAKLDFAALRGSGVDPEPKGIRNQGVNVIDLGANGATPTNFDFLVDAIAAIRDENGVPNAAIYASRTATTLDKLVDSTGQPLRQPESVASLTKLVSNAVPTNLTHGTANNSSEAYVADWGTVLIGVRPTLSVRVVPLTERFSDNFQVGLMAYLRADVQLAHPQHAAVVTGLLP